jgi:surface protein
MFGGCTGLTSVEALTNWNVSNVISMSNMFSGCAGITSLEPLRNWNVGNVSSMGNMFSGCAGITSLAGLENWTVDKVTNMTNTFSGCTGLTSLAGLEDWNVEKVTNIGNLFQNCTGITSLEPIANWKVDNVTVMGYTFYKCTGLTTLAGLEGWNVGNVVDTVCTFAYCKLSSIDAILNWDLSNVNKMHGMFSEAEIPSADFSNWKVGAKVTTAISDIMYQFAQGAQLTSDNAVLDLRGWNSTMITKLGHRALDFKNVSVVRMDDWDLVNYTSRIASGGDYNMDDLFCFTLNGAEIYPPVIYQSFDMSHFTLSHDTILRFINQLPEVEEPRTMTIGDANLAKINDDEIAIAIDKNWSIL